MLLALLVVVLLMVVLVVTNWVMHDALSTSVSSRLDSFEASIKSLVSKVTSKL